MAATLQLQRAWSILEIKSASDDGDQRIIVGTATTPTVDRAGDVVDPLGAQVRLPLPLLLAHDHSRPIGEVTHARATKAGIAITAKIAKGVLPYIDEAWALIKAGLIRGLSIGFRPIESSPLEATGGRRFGRWEMLEISACVVPMNHQATIQTIKSFDQAVRQRKPGCIYLSDTPGRVVRRKPSAVYL